jgi:hypothetical protein
MAKTITIKTTAWLLNGASPDCLKDRDNVDGIGFATHDMSRCEWSAIGDAVITVEVTDGRGLIDNKVEALKAEKQRVIADAEMASRRIEQQIQNLLAITHEVPSHV